MVEEEADHYRYRVRLLIKHPTVDPALLTKALGLVPRLSWKAGEPRQTPIGTALPGVYEASAWGYSRWVEGTRFFFNDVVDLLQQLEPHAESLSNIVETGGTITMIVHLPGDVNIGDIIKSPQLNRLASLRIDLGIEVFPDFGDAKRMEAPG